MHDPDVVAFEIKRPWPRRRTKYGRYWPSLITVWHREPGGKDSGEICKHHTRYQKPDGKWTYRIHHAWKLHVHHWRIQVHSLQTFRRWALTRCAWCGGRSRKGDYAGTSLSWDGPRGRWWRGEPGLYHHDCSSIAIAHRQCLCEDPVCVDSSAEHGPYGRCARCGKSRSFGTAERHMAVRRLWASVPTGQRDPAVTAKVRALADAHEATP